jgi:HSP20 family protein
MTILRWNPFREIDSLQSQLQQIFDGADVAPSGGFIPPVDIYEDANHIVLTVEAPGLKQEDLQIQLENNVLTVRGERKFEQETKEKNYHHIERRYGSFARTFTLPTTVDADKVQASYDAGLLRIELGKKAEAQPKQIPVSVGGAVQGGAKQVEGKTAAA